MTMQPISGAYVKILYEFEDVYGYPKGGVISEESIKNITRILGHGIKVDTWQRDNGLRAITGLNNVEASDIIDGPFNGTFSVSFAAIADVAWMKAIMGYEDTVSSSNPITVKYTKFLTPPSMSFVIYMNNDSTEPTYGNAFLLTGVVVSSVNFTVESGDNPVQVTMECAYKTEYKYDVTDIPVINTPLEHPFNFSMVNAYFWNPNKDINDNPSFDSIECTIDRLTFSIKHTATLLRGIGTRVAKNKVHANIEYELSMSAIFTDPKKFLERFYGCYNTPSKYIAPYSQVKIVIENFFRDAQHAKLMFAFKNVKIKSDSLPLAIENVIMEEMTLLPTICDITVERGCPSTPSVTVSPSVVQIDDVLYVSGANFAPGEDITITSVGLFGTVNANANCLGELDYSYILTNPEPTRGTYTITVASDSIGSTDFTTNVLVISPDDLLATSSVCKTLFHADPNTGTEISIVGANFVDVAGHGHDVYIGLSSKNDVTGIWSSTQTIGSVDSTLITNDGMFTFTASDVFEDISAGNYKIVVNRGLECVSQNLIYVPEIKNAVLASGSLTLDIIGRYFPPLSNVQVTYVDGTTRIGLGLHAVSSTGWMPGRMGATADETSTLTCSRSSAFPVVGTPTVEFNVVGVNNQSFTTSTEVKFTP